MAYFSISNTTTGEILSEIAIRNRDAVLGQTQEAASRNLKLLDRFMSDHRDVLGWILPRGGMTAFPCLLSGESDRQFCQAAPSMEFCCRLGIASMRRRTSVWGFAAAGSDFPKALDRFGEFVRTQVVGGKRAASF